MLTIGLDQHKHFSQVAVTDEKGTLLNEQKLLHSDRAIITRYFEQFKGNARVAMESTGSWTWLCDLLEQEGFEVHLAHPLKTRIICESKIKTDKVDAKMLAHLLRTNLLAESYKAPFEVRQERQKLRYRQSLIQVRVGMKNRIHGLLAQFGITPPAISDIFGKEGMLWLRDLTLPGPYAVSLKGYLELIEEVEHLINEADKQIKAGLKNSPAAWLLDTVPGVGILTAHLVIAEIGDINRFPSAKKLCSYAGIVPSTYQSGESLYHGRITRQGNRYLRWALTESAQKAHLKDPKLAYFYNKIAAKKGKPKAAVALARKLLVIIYHVLKHNEPYNRYSGKPVAAEWSAV
jgi:transposase